MMEMSRDTLEIECELVRRGLSGNAMTKSQTVQREYVDRLATQMSCQLAGGDSEGQMGIWKCKMVFR